MAQMLGSMPTGATKADVAFCSLERVGRHAWLSVCTTAGRWQLFRLDRFASGSRETLTPINVRRRSRKLLCPDASV